MTARSRIAVPVLLALLLLLTIVQAHRLAQRMDVGTIDLAGRDPATLSTETRRFLSALESGVSLTYFVSSRDRMPSHLRGIERGVRRLLDALEREAPTRIDVRVLDPELGGDAGLAYAASRQAAPFRERLVVHDETGEQAIWSSLVITGADGQQALIQGVRTADLPYLESLIIEHLRAMTSPPRATLALAGGDAFRGLEAVMAESGDVIRLDLDTEPEIPPGADVLFWMQPTASSAARLDAMQRSLRRFIDNGRTVVLAGSPYIVHYVLDGGRHVGYQARSLGPTWSTLLAGLGLRAAPDLLLDRTSGEVVVHDDTGTPRVITAPFHLRCLPAFYDMKSFRGPARGALGFVAAGPLALEPRTLAAAGFSAEIVATTTEEARVAALPTGRFDDRITELALPVPKQNLAVLLRPDDPWRGQVLVLASASPFEDGFFEQPGHAHRVFTRTVLRTFTETSRIVRGRIERPAPPPTPALGTGARLAWRLAVAMLIPGVLIVLGMRHAIRSGALAGAARPGGRLLLVIAAVGIMVLLLVQVPTPFHDLELDLTRDRIHTAAPLTRQLLDEQRDGLRVEHVLSPRSELPLALESVGTQAARWLDREGIGLETRRPSTMTRDEQEALRRLGLAPFRTRTVVGDSLVSTEVWSGLRLRRRHRTEIIPRLDEQTARHQEFLIAAALRRLGDEDAPHVAVVSDLPRLSPAEAFEQYQKAGLIAPSGTDVYSLLKDLLRDYGFRVSYVNPRAPVMPDDVDVLLWLQPRRDSGPIQQLLAAHLAAGGNALVALQHFNIQQRQYRGAGFETVYWPQPQFQDLSPWLQSVGVEQVREILMDRTSSHLSLATQVHRAATPELDPQQVALPFLIRCVPAGHAVDSPITRNLGDLLFIWGNRFVIDQERLRAAGMGYRVLLETSAEAWSYDWQGGWLPPESLVPETYLPGPQTLALELEGRFAPADDDARLILIGSSEMFKNDHLQRSGYAHDQLLLNAVTTLTWGDDMAALLTRAPTPAGFAYRSPSAKTAWRLIVIGSGPLALVLLGVHHARRSRRATGTVR